MKNTNEIIKTNDYIKNNSGLWVRKDYVILINRIYLPNTKEDNKEKIII